MINSFYKTYFKFLKYFNLIDIVILVVLYYSYKLKFNLVEYTISLVFVFGLCCVNHIYHIKKIKIKHNFKFNLWAICIKLISFSIIINLLTRLDDIKNFENFTMFLIWFVLGYSFLNSYAFLIEDKRSKLN